MGGGFPLLSTSYAPCSLCFSHAPRSSPGRPSTSSPHCPQPSLPFTSHPFPFQLWSLAKLECSYIQMTWAAGSLGAGREGNPPTVVTTLGLIRVTLQ